MGRKNRGQEDGAGIPERGAEQQEFAPEQVNQDQVTDAVKEGSSAQRGAQQASHKTQYHKPKKFGHN
ncbi:hypothetical protein G5C51_18390 [Streptomyces sp. A7024]|uniref:Uncharacterized protein n=1 Tax=Streptomyces coryli TaxID=1128680 RepID=A0A6G4U2C4_9ACTN|nr:hypothetical protein [Streptomyces coryli]NGN65856.1 hypothetical protein [Streptomyces coryli]